MVISKPYCYNVAQNKNGDVFLGTANGIFKLEGDNMIPFSPQSGYIKMDVNGNPDIDSAGISRYQSRKYLYLLPYPNEIREEYHTGNTNNFYVVSGGKLFVFDITLYSIQYRNQSIRSISKNLVGGYSGVYYKGNKLAFPNYTDGYIREFGDTVFICYGGLMMITPDKTENFLIEPAYFAVIDNVEIGTVDDIFYHDGTKEFIISSHKGVYVVGKDLKAPRKIYSCKPGDPIVLFGSKYNNFLFSSGKTFFNYSFQNKQTIVVDSVANNIVSSAMLNLRNIYTLTSNKLYESLSSGFFNEITTFKEAHTLLALNEKELIISSNIGLFLYNVETNTTHTIISGVEFNRKALYLDSNKLYAGSVVGLYTFDVDKINAIIQHNEFKSTSETSFTNYLYWGIFIGLLFFALVFWMILLNKKLKRAEKEIITVRNGFYVDNEKNIDKATIEQFIRDNLANASIKSINEHFNTNQLYAIFEPEKPGTIIQKLRLELVTEMKNSGLSIQEISAASGLSESYLKKLKFYE